LDIRYGAKKVFFIWHCSIRLQRHMFMPWTARLQQPAEHCAAFWKISRQRLALLFRNRWETTWEEKSLFRLWRIKMSTSNSTR
jgi:hypothetical protein